MTMIEQLKAAQLAGAKVVRTLEKIGEVTTGLIVVGVVAAVCGVAAARYERAHENYIPSITLACVEDRDGGPAIAVVPTATEAGAPLGRIISITEIPAEAGIAVPRCVVEKLPPGRPASEPKAADHE